MDAVEASAVMTRTPAPPAARGARGGRPRERGASLLPREHGAYGQLLLPLVVAHLTGTPTAVGWLVTAASLAAFVGHEPWLVLLGRRGPRALRERGAGARGWLAATAALGLGCATAALVLAEPTTRLAAALPALLAAAVAWLIVRDREHTFAGELVVGLALPALAVPVAIAGAVEPRRALAACLVWGLASLASTGAVRAVVAHLKKPLPVTARVASTLAATLLALASSLAGALDARGVIALVPVLEVAGLVAVVAPHPKMLRVVGFTLLGANVVTALLLAL